MPRVIDGHQNLLIELLPIGQSCVFFGRNGHLSAAPGAAWILFSFHHPVAKFNQAQSCGLQFPSELFVGAKLPNGVKPDGLPSELTQKISQVCDYGYAKMKDQILIVNEDHSRDAAAKDWAEVRWHIARGRVQAGAVPQGRQGTQISPFFSLVDIGAAHGRFCG